MQTLEEFMRTGDPGLAQRVRDLEHEGDDLKSANLDTLNSAFSTPMDREELYRAIATIDLLVRSPSASFNDSWLRASYSFRKAITARSSASRRRSPSQKRN